MLGAIKSLYWAANFDCLATGKSGIYVGIGLPEELQRTKIVQAIKVVIMEQNLQAFC